jgi:alpha-1,3-mannosyltransferase
MQEVTMWQEGERDYLNIRGGTGPLVYPAGVLHLFGALKWIAGGDGQHRARSLF